MYRRWCVPSSLREMRRQVGLGHENAPGSRARAVVAGEGGEVGVAVSQTVEDRGLPLLRHLLSQ